MTETGSPVYSHMVRWSNTAQLHNFFSAGINNGDGLSNFIERYAAGLPDGFMAWHPLARAQYTEIRIFLTNYLLSSQGDRMAMANAVEGRYPFLDYRVIEVAARIPPRFKLNGLTEKFILKKLARDYVPKELIDRPKQPYRAPISGCFFNDKPAGIRRRDAVGDGSQKGRLLRCRQGGTACGQVQDKRRAAPERARKHGPGGDIVDPVAAPAVH